MATFPREEVAELALPGIKLGERIRLAELDEREIEDSFDCWNLKKIGRRAVWMTANRARIQAYVAECSQVSTLQVNLMVRPFNPPQYKQPQRVDVELNGVARATAEWAPGSDDPLKLSLRIPHDGSRRCMLDIVIDARTARSPRSLGFSNIDDRLAVRIDEIAIDAPASVVQR
jgi:hypothetical protein